MIVLITVLQTYLDDVFDIVKDIGNKELPEDFNDRMIELLGDVPKGVLPTRSINSNHIKKLRLIKMFIGCQDCINSWLVELQEQGYN